jgi:hypothetical protein
MVNLKLRRVGQAQFSDIKGMEKIALEIEKRAFDPFLPLLGKPRLELDAWPHRNRPIIFISGRKPSSKTSPYEEKRRGMKTTAWKGATIPFDSQSIGSILMFLPEGFVCSLKRLLHESFRVLEREGKIAIGFIPRESPWAQFYREKRKRLFSLTPPPRIYSLKEMEHRMMEAGFSIQGYFCTLFQKPGEAKELENPFRGYHLHAGFLVLLGERRTRQIGEKKEKNLE